jgi:hypothetical protein
VGTQESAGSEAPSRAPAQLETPTERLRVLYIGGTGRTGSTLLTMLLGQYPQFFAGGELAFLWRFGFLDQGKCGCGELLAECPVWVSIFKQAFGDARNVDAEEMMRLRGQFNSKHLPLMFTKGLRERLLRRAGEFPATVERLYQAIPLATGSRVIVDSSKEPHYSYILRSIPSLDVYFLHLVRDPRAVAYSWKENRKKESGLSRDALMESRGAFVSAAYFDVSNVTSELMWARRHDRYRFLRYEDFLADPKGTIRMIGEFVGEDIDPDLVFSDGKLHLGPSHTAWGNPDRLVNGPIPLKTEETWRTRMPKERQLAVTALTLPLMAHYRYPAHIGPLQPAPPPRA